MITVTATKNDIYTVLAMTHQSRKNAQYKTLREAVSDIAFQHKCNNDPLVADIARRTAKGWANADNATRLAMSGEFADVLIELA